LLGLPEDLANLQARPSPGKRAPGWPGAESLRLGRGGQGVAPRRPPPTATTRQPRDIATPRTHRYRRGLSLGRRAVGLTADGMPQIPNCKICDPLPCRRVWSRKHLTQNQMLGERHRADQSLQPKILLAYISWYINDYRRPWTSSDVSQRIRLNPGQIAGTGGYCLRLRNRRLRRRRPWPAPGL
jgi:hypothetical protein